MGLLVPIDLTHILAEIDNSTQPINEIELSGRLSAAIKEPDSLTNDERKGAFAEIEAFRFQRPHGDEPSHWGTYWRELASGTMKSGIEFYTPDISDVDEEIVSYWVSRSGIVKHPILKARYSDLAWEIGRYIKSHKDKSNSPTNSTLTINIPYTLSQAAIDAYLDSVEKSLYDDEYDAWKFLERAIGLSVSINDLNRIKQSKKSLFDLYRKLEATGNRFMWWRFDDLTWSYSKELGLQADEKQEVINALEQVLGRSSDFSNRQHFDPHDAMSAADRLGRRRAQTNERDEARRAIKTAALAFEEVAKQASGLTAIAWLEDLISRYRNEGMIDDAARVEQTIRDRAEEAQAEMKRIEVPISIPKEEFDQWVEKVTGKSLDEALDKIAIACLIKKDSTQASLRSMHENAPLSALMPISVLGTDGFTTAKIGSIEGDLEGRSIHHAADRLGWHTSWLSYALNGAREKYDIDTDSLIAALQGCPFFAPDREPLLREGITAWLDGDSFKSIHILVPQIEAALRDLLAALGASVMISDSDTGGFQVIGFGKILSHEVFQSEQMKDFRFHLKALYCDPRGINLRNNLAHGLLGPEMFNLGLANWVMHTVILISKLRLKSS